MTKEELKELMMRHNVSESQLKALTEHHFEALSKIPVGVFEDFIENGINAQGYHDGGVGENPLGLDCGECCRNCCLGCDIWNDLTLLCGIFGIKYKEGTYPDLEKYIIVPRWGILLREEFIKGYGADAAKRFDNGCPTEEDLRDICNHPYRRKERRNV